MKYPYFLALTIAAFAGASMLLIGLHEGIQIREEMRDAIPKAQSQYDDRA